MIKVRYGDNSDFLNCFLRKEAKKMRNFLENQIKYAKFLVKNENFSSITLIYFRHANMLKTRLGITAWREFSTDIKVKTSMRVSVLLFSNPISISYV